MCSHLAKIAKCLCSNSSRKKMLTGDRKKEKKRRRALNSSLVCVTSGKASVYQGREYLEISSKR